MSIGKILKNIALDEGEHLITLNVTDTSGETSKAVIKVIVLKSPDGRENQAFTALIIGSAGILIIVIFLILFLFIHFKKKKIPEGLKTSKKDIKPSIKDQLQPTHISPGSPSLTYQINKNRPQDLPTFRCPSCGNAIYEKNKCLNCRWMGKST